MATPASPQKETKRKMEIDDLYRIRLVADPQASPDSKMVAYVQTRLRKKQNDYASNIWLVPADGSAQPSKFTGSDKRDMMPRWAPDGEEIAFVSTRSGKPQIWVIRVRGGEARQLTHTKRGVGEFAWSPSGQWIVFSTQVDNELDKKWAAEAEAKAIQKAKGGPSEREDEDEGNGSPPDSENRISGQRSGEGSSAPIKQAEEWEEDAEDEKEVEDKGDHARVITRVHIKEEGAGVVSRRTHLFIVPSKGGEPKQITDGDWDAGSPRWAPDGKSLAFVASQEPDAELHNIQDIFVMPIDDGGKPGETRRVTHHDSALMSMDWLPSGDGFAVFAHSRTQEAALATNAQMWTISLDGAIHKLTADFDRTVGSWINSDLWSGTGELRPRFSHDGKTIYFLVTNEGAGQVYSVPVEGGEVKQVIGGKRQVLNFGVAEHGIVFAASDAVHPCDLFVADFNGAHERQLTYVNRDVLGELEISEPREFWLERPDGARIQCWMLMPPGFDEKNKYPLVLQIHGGPHVAYGDAFFHEFQVLASRGYIVLYTNPRGSQGYGQQFAEAIRNDWGGIDYDDLMAAVDYAVALPYVDEERLGVAGGSYGGYMTVWMIGHTQRFKAAVAMRAVTNLYSAWGSGDVTWMLWSWEFEGTPQERTQLYLERSPVTYVKEMHTPLLLTHSEDDYRVDIEQAAELYIALKVLGRTVKMVRFPSGGHDVSRSGKPSLRVERLEYIADWLDEFLQPK